MKEYFLSYYPEFKCVADKCKHTCCAGWEMNIDCKSLSAYKNENSDFSNALKKGVDFKKSKFKADKNKRCAFLSGKGLCEIIINLGENALCQVCRDHPRFRSFFNDRTETGLGFCCEEATRIILSYNGKITPVLKSDDNGREELDFNQKNLLQFRKEALEIVQDRSVPIDDRISSLLKLCRAEHSSQNYKKVVKTLFSAERLDKGWTKRLKSLKMPFNPSTGEDLSLCCEQFLANGLYRHLSYAEDTLWVRAITVALIYSWWIIKDITDKTKEKGQDRFELLSDVVRAYSSEVEYSQKNSDKLFSVCYKFIKV